MSTHLSETRIPEERLAEQWYGLLHKVISSVQIAYRNAAKETGLTQKVMAKRLGMNNPEVISRCISGQKNMTLRTLHNLARAMDCRLDIAITPLSSLKVFDNAPAKTPPLGRREGSSSAAAQVVYKNIEVIKRVPEPA
ncbi:helix-turn-helix domain-containing protein [Mesorhizobium sp. M0621]|uniref:helix-turn-helix domain-containing protein n=1 Tax=unclassified Mesorhizobium TaxID=325217 RepID=UPI0033366658